MLEDAPDTAHSAAVTDHHYIPPEGYFWGRCQFEYEDHRVCGMAEAAHAAGPIEDTDPGRPASMRNANFDLEADKTRIQEYFEAQTPTAEQQEEFKQLQEDLSKIEKERLKQLQEDLSRLEEERSRTQGKALVDGKRQRMWGDPIPNMERFAAVLSGYFGIPVTSHDATMVQILYKVVRSKANPSMPDNYNDMEGYAEIGRRIGTAGGEGCSSV